MMKEYSPMPSNQMRNSSIELYRIIATFTVLIVHFNGWFVGGMPDRYDLANPSLFRTGQMIIEAATCICVNMFIIISGYFGIKLKMQSVLKLCLILVLIFVPAYMLRCMFSLHFGITSLIRQFLVISRAGYFIQCYMMLMFLSPVLNSYIEKYGKKSAAWILVFFFLEFWFGCIMGVEDLGFNHGYSVIHFVLIYMIARLIKLYETELMKVKYFIWIIGYVLCTLIICLMYIGGIKFCWDYSNPIVVVSSVCSFMPFLYLSFYNRRINWVGSGTLAVYIIQVTRPYQSYLESIDKSLLLTNPYPVYLIKALGVIILTFLFSIIYGKCCNYIISPIVERTSDKLKVYNVF